MSQVDGPNSSSPQPLGSQAVELLDKKVAIKKFIAYQFSRGVVSEHHFDDLLRNFDDYIYQHIEPMGPGEEKKAVTIEQLTVEIAVRRQALHQMYEQFCEWYPQLRRGIDRSIDNSRGAWGGSRRG